MSKLGWRTFFIMLCCTSGCTEHQTGLYEVSKHVSVQGEPSYSEVDLFYGKRLDRKDAQEELLLCLFFWDGGANSERSVRSVSSQGSGTTCRVDFHGSGNTVTYGSFWDREHDVLTLGSREFRRSEGNVFLIVGPNAPQPRYFQVPIQVGTENDLNAALINFAKSQKDLPDFQVHFAKGSPKE